MDLEGPGKMATTGRKATNLPHPNKWFLSNFPSEHLASCKFFFQMYIRGKYTLTVEQKDIGKKDAGMKALFCLFPQKRSILDLV